MSSVEFNFLPEWSYLRHALMNPEQIVMVLIADEEGRFQWVPGPGEARLNLPQKVTALEFQKANFICGMQAQAMQAVAQQQAQGVQLADGDLLAKLKARQNGR